MLLKTKGRLLSDGLFELGKGIEYLKHRRIGWFNWKNLRTRQVSTNKGKNKEFRKKVTRAKLGGVVCL